ncbi:MAG: hypothetical protein BMS9Abin26_0340 [Gammaproteobacteria bacterium]|nr:MAG: hypothetical protein BMS9Abin26_0340 [Gammaproteobacteria bacterium]
MNAKESKPGNRFWPISAETRNDPEFHQANIRFAYLLFGISYFSIAINVGYLQITTTQFILFAILFFSSTTALLISTILHPGYIPRRYIALVIDVITATAAITATGGATSPFSVVYVWIYMSQAARFGRRFLYTSAWMSLLGYGYVLITHDVWNTHAYFYTAFVIIMLLIVPIYIDMLLRQLQESRRIADTANKAKGDFLANMSHEIRTPISGVIGMINLLKTTDTSQEQNNYIESLDVSANHLLMLINDILDFSKIEAGKLELEVNNFSISKLIQDTTAVLQPLASKKHLELTTLIDSSLPEMVLGDRHRIAQVIMNLAGNAIKFTEKGQVSIRVSRANVVEGTQLWLCIEIEDTGIGIPESKLATIFDVFTQADSSTTRRFGGTGLGTAISRELVWLMKGNINVISEEGVGSNFWFDIPLQEVNKNQQPHSKAMPLQAVVDETLATGQTANILVAEDNIINAKFIVNFLEKAGHIVHHADNGIKALEYLRAHQYDVIFMDMHMPKLDGKETTRQWRQIEKTSPVPIIALTASTTEQDRKECIQAGMNDFIAKPVRPEQLLSIVDKYTA